MFGLPRHADGYSRFLSGIGRAKCLTGAGRRIGDRTVVEQGSEHRFNHIHEGTFGIQGMDLLGRKVGDDGGKTLLRLEGAFEVVELRGGPRPSTLGRDGCRGPTGDFWR